MSQARSLYTLALVAAGAITAERFVAVAGTQAGAAANTWGVARADAAIGEVVPVDAIGTAIVTAGAAVAANALIETDAQGRAITRAAGPIVARALQAAGAAGDRIEVMLIPN
jgi:hypothetical protein